MARRGRGRPTKLTQALRKNRDGTIVTTGDAIVSRIRLGLEYQSACDSAGICRQTLHEWRLKGARLRAQQTQGMLRNPTDDERALMDFLDNLERAEAEAEANRLAVISQAAQGGTKVRKTTIRYDSKGKQIERTVIEETLKPEWKAAAWVLERRYPNRYAKRLEVTGADGSELVPPAQQARDLAENLKDFQAGVQTGKTLPIIDVTEEDIDEPEPVTEAIVAVESPDS